MLLESAAWIPTIVFSAPGTRIEKEPVQVTADRERILKEISEAFETKALLAVRLETLGYTREELEDAMENTQYYIHQLLKSGTGQRN